eukprot:2388133-Ditylum_brightwellii.AAC.1
MEVVAQRLLDPNAKKIDVLLLDNVVAAAYDLVSPYKSAVNKALVALQEAPNCKFLDSLNLFVCVWDRRVYRWEMVEPCHV